MKKILMLFLAVCISLLCLTACGDAVYELTPLETLAFATLRVAATQSALDGSGSIEADFLDGRNFPEGRELILFKVNFVLNKYSSDREDDPQWRVSGSRFAYFNGDYSEVSEFVSIAGLDKLGAELYEGGSTSGWCYTTVDPDDNRPTARYDDRVWLALY